MDILGIQRSIHLIPCLFGVGCKAEPLSLKWSTGFCVSHHHFHYSSLHIYTVVINELQREGGGKVNSTMLIRSGMAYILI